MDILKKYRWKVINTTVLLISTVVYCWSIMYWQTVCIGQDACSFNFMTGVLLPVKSAALFLCINFFVFLFLPQSYFRRYITRWFWWLFLIAFVVAAITEPVAGSMVGFDRDLVVKGLGISLVAQAFLFVVLTLYKKRKA
ncbi:hypothetical protein KC573_03990 [candidate division WWE3 bacterium]|uniref:Uncharacterized protein n=1 Tax=candidate division WWE3 bacterium TaxID=2053526 RepID=A0A955LWI7_UNCKA|nr:hypothetical protein [candidate division WWE3 bacterium]